MDSKVFKAAVKNIETTLGELVEAITKVAAEHTDNEREQYMLATQALAELTYQNKVSYPDRR